MAARWRPCRPPAIRPRKGFEPCCRVFCACRMTISPPCASWRNSDDIVAVLLEPVQGEGGIRVAGADYLRDLRALCDRHGC